MQAAATAVPVPAQAPAPAAQPVIAGQPGPATAARVVGVEGIPNAADVLRGAREQRRELRNQLEGLEQKRRELRNELEQNPDTEAKAGILARLKEVDARILATDGLIMQADAAVANASAIPGALVEPPRPPRDGPPEEAIIMGGMVMLAAVLPLSIAYARRIWKRGATIIAPVPREVQERLDGLSHAVESIGLEVERIGEGQRFITKVMAEKQPAMAIRPGEQVG